MTPGGEPGVFFSSASPIPHYVLVTLADFLIGPQAKRSKLPRRAEKEICWTITDLNNNSRTFTIYLLSFLYFSW
jgi:hypothetical protein